MARFPGLLVFLAVVTIIGINLHPDNVLFWWLGGGFTGMALIRFCEWFNSRGAA